MTSQHFIQIFLRIVQHVKTEVENLFLAGDWVKLDNPAMLMEAATTSALYAANSIFNKENLKEEHSLFCPIKRNLCMTKLLQYINILLLI